jgi:putative transposase
MTPLLPDDFIHPQSLQIFLRKILDTTKYDQVITDVPECCHRTVHSDRGCHYRWSGWIERMNGAGLTRSMSKKGCFPDNAACEGFFGRLKNEMF